MPDNYALSDYGRTAISEGFKTHTFFLAWGDLQGSIETPWTTSPPDPLTPLRQENVTRGNGLVDTLSRSPVVSVASIFTDFVTYATPADYVVVGDQIDWSPPGTQPAQNQVYRAKYRYQDAKPTSLLHELGRVEIKGSKYVKLDVAGPYIFDGIHYANSTDPTNHLLLQFEFPSTAVPTGTIYQLGLFKGVVRATGVASSVKYLAPNQVANPGQLLLVDNIEPISRAAGKRELFNFLLTF